jgi:membrane fusion protein (multidrug efflux system)
MKLSRAATVITVAAVAVTLLGSGIYFRIKGEGEAAAAAATPAAAEGERPVIAMPISADVANPVKGARVIRDTLVVSVAAAGQASSFQAAAVHAQVSGRVLEVRVREDDEIRGEDVIVVIEPTDLEIALERARIALGQAEARYTELTILEDRIDDPLVRAQRERSFRANSGLEQAELNLRVAERDLEQSRVKAPFAGRAANIRVVPGQWVRSGEELMTIMQLNPIRLDVHVMEGEVVHIERGRSARVEFSAYPGERFVGRIESINPVIEAENARTARVTVSVPNPDGRLLPGMYAQVSLQARRYADRILVPLSAVVERDRSPVVFVYQGDERAGVAMWRYVRTGLRSDEYVEILYLPGEERSDRLDPGEIVLVDGHNTLSHQAPVRLVENVREAGGRPQ